MKNQRQQALQSLSICRLVSGNPGVGKTYFGCEIAEYEIRTRRIIRLPYQKVLFLTFARNAVARIKEAYCSQTICATGESVSNSSSRQTMSMDRIRIDTFAGFFWWLVGSYGRYAPGGSDLRPWLLGHSEVGYEIVPDGHVGFTFDEIQNCAHMILQMPAIRSLISELYPLVIIDEHQDIDEHLHQIITLLGKSSSLVLLRGPGQCIYGGMKHFDPETVYRQTLDDLCPQVFHIYPNAPEQQRYCSQVAEYLAQYNAGESCHYDGQRTILKLVPQQTRKGRPNELETHAAMMVRDIRTFLRTMYPHSNSSIAVLASTNNGVADIHRRLIAGSDAYNLFPIRASLFFDDTLLLHYGRLIFELLHNHWIAARRTISDLNRIAIALTVLFHSVGEQSQTTFNDWHPLAQELERTVSSQKEPTASKPAFEKLGDDLRKINNCLRATRANLPKDSPSTPFTRADGSLLQQLTQCVLDVIEPLFQTGRPINVDNARRAFENRMGQRIFFEKLGLHQNIEVMTIHKAKGREFAGSVLVFENNRKALWKNTSKTSDAELVDLYRVAVSRARDVLGVVAYRGAQLDANPTIRHLLKEIN